MIVLRDDQATLKRGIYDAWNRRARNVLAVLPTGGGKSVVVSDIALDKHSQGAVQCIMAHRVELVGQMSMHIARRGIKHRIIAPKGIVSAVVAKHRKEFNGHSFLNPDANCAVAGVDTLIARKDELAKWCGQVDDWTIDEAHHVLRLNKWGTAAALFPNAMGLGVTATPSRADGAGLGRHADGLFDEMIIGPYMRPLIAMGALTDYEIAVPDGDFSINDTDLTPGGEFSPTKVREASDRSTLTGDVVREYLKRAYGKRGICFAIDVKDANDIAARFNAAGIPAAAVNAKTPEAVRDDYVERFRDGRLWMLVNVDLFGEGFDVPAVEVVIMARPTASLGVYLQQFGRALRTLPGKLYGLIIDHVGNVKRHGLPDKLHYWTLDRREKRGKKEKDPEEIPLTVCRDCSRPFERFHTGCPYCGWQIPPPASGARTIEQVDGDLVLLDRETLAQMRAAVVLDSPADVGGRVAAVAGPIAGQGAVNKQIARIQAQKHLEAVLAQFAGCERAKGRPDRETHKRLYLTTGLDVLTALSLPRAEMEALATQIEGWYR